MQKNAKMWNRFAKRYASSPVANEEVYQEKLALTRALLTPASEVLEFGCGTGSTAIALAADAKHILATDFSSKMLDIAKAKADAAGVRNITFQVSGIEELDVGGNRFDMVMAHSILHLVDDHPSVIAKVHSILKPGGSFVSSTACLGDGFHFLKPLTSFGNWIGLLPRVHFFSVRTLVDGITNAGFEIEQEWLPKGSDAVFIIARKPA